MEGEHFLAGNPQVTVRFGNIPLSIVPESSRLLTVTVPPGAVNGPVTVTTTATVEGRVLEQTSNPANVLVLLNEMNGDLLRPVPAPYLSWIVQTLPGSEEDFYVFSEGTQGGWIQQRVWRVRAGGSLETILSHAYSSAPGNSGYSWEQLARNPVDGHFVAVRRSFWEEGSPPRQQGVTDLVDLETGRVLNGGYGDQAPVESTWRFWKLGYDGEGDLFLLAWQRVNGWPHLWSLALWRYGPSEAVVLDPAKVVWMESSIPAFNVGADLAVGADGTAWLAVATLAGDLWSTEIHRLEKNGGHTVFSAPPGLADVSTFNAISIAADCMGRAFVHNPCQWDSECRSPFSVYVYPPGEAVADMGGLRHAWDSEVDGYGDLYLFGGRSSDGQRVVRRLRPQEMADPHFYDTFDCCALESHKALLEGQAKPPGVRIPPEVCDLGGRLRIRLISEPEDPISGWEGNPNQFTWIEGDGQGRAEARVLFGQAPKLQAFWKPAGGGEETVETVKWEIAAGSETAPNADPKGLYPGKPAVFFTGGQNPYEHAELRFQTVHTGSFVLTATSTNSGHKGTDGQPAKIEITFTVAPPAGLRGRPATHDPKILQYADRYGIPPQYLKAQAFHESGLNTQAFRYEPRTVDKNGLSAKNEAYWTNSRWDLYRYRLPINPGISFIEDSDLAPRRIYHVSEFQDAEPPAWPYACHELGPESTYDPVTLFQVFEANDGWPCGTTPWKTYNPEAKDAQGNWKCGLETRIGPCGVRNGWWDAERPFNSDLETTVTSMRHTNTFYCGWIRSEPCAPTESESQWLLNHGDYVAQTVVASSYGLMQVLYTTAVQTQGWLAGNGRGAERHPARLFDPDVSLDLGARFDARQTACQLGDASWNFTSLEAFREAWIRGFGAYNTGKCSKRKDDYANAILRTAASMWPVGGSTP